MTIVYLPMTVGIEIDGVNGVNGGSMDKLIMKVHVKYRLRILVYCMNILGYIYLPSAIKLGDYIIKNLDKYIVVKGA